MEQECYNSDIDDQMFSGFSEMDIRDHHRLLKKSYPWISNYKTEEAYIDMFCRFSKHHYVNCADSLNCEICCSLGSKFPQTMLIEKRLHNLWVTSN